MKKTIAAIFMISAFFVTLSSAQARDTKLMLPIKTVMSSPEVKEVTKNSAVKYYFGNQGHPKVIRRLGSYSSNKKANAFGRSDEKACKRAFLSALISLKKRANSLGANAVINIKSYYKKRPYSSRKVYECHAGALMAGVALKGDFVKVSRK